MKISPKLANRESLREVISFGVWNFVSAGSARLISYTDALVIAAFMPVAAVAPFAIAANLRSYFDEIFVRVGFVFFPAVTELDARGDQAGLRQALPGKLEVHVLRIDCAWLYRDLLGARFFSALGWELLC